MSFSKIDCTFGSFPEIFQMIGVGGETPRDDRLNVVEIFWEQTESLDKVETELRKSFVFLPLLCTSYNDGFNLSYSFCTTKFVWCSMNTLLFN